MHRSIGRNKKMGKTRIETREIRESLAKTDNQAYKISISVHTHWNRGPFTYAFGDINKVFPFKTIFIYIYICAVK